MILRLLASVFWGHPTAAVLLSGLKTNTQIRGLEIFKLTENSFFGLTLGPFNTYDQSLVVFAFLIDSDTCS